jgi:hypothetical protein
MAEEEPDGVPLRLYLQLEQGHVADLFVVTQATAAFGAGVKELAYILDPSLDLYIGLGPSSAGSLWENTVLRAKAEYKKRELLYTLAASATLWFMQPPADRVRENLWQPFLNRYLPPAGTPEHDQALDDVKRVTSGRVAERERQQAYRALDRDTGIEAVGVSIELKRPTLLVPRAEFRARAGVAETITSDEDRVTTGPAHATLIRPVLDASPRRWKFAGAQGEFGATMKDQKFLAAVVEGRTGVPLRAGIEMDLLLETRERFSDGVWQIVERNVVEVLGIRAPPSERQGSIFPE